MLKKVYLELTDSCNLECEICYRHQWTQEPVDMTEDLWKNTVNQIRENKTIETVVLGGMGEPLVFPYFAKTVEFLSQKKIWVTSNATLFREQLTKDIASKIHLFVVSCDGMEQQMVQGRGVVFDELVASIDHLNRLKEEMGTETPYLDIQFVASKKNIDDIFPLMDILAEKKVRNLVISHLLPQRADQAVDFDCNGESPNCADCLWARKFVFCN